MTIEHMDNFSIYGTNNALLLNGIYAQQSVGLVTDPDGVSGGHVSQLVNYTNGSFTELRYALQTGAVEKVGVAQRVWLDSLPISNVADPYLVWVRSAANASLAFLRVSANGSLIMSVNGVDVDSTPLPVIGANGWWHIEMMYSADGLGTCDYEVRVEGLTVLQDSGVAAAAAQPGQIAWGGRNVNTDACPTWYVKDLVIWNGTGTYNTNFLGSVLVHSLLPDSDVSLNWTPYTGAVGWSILDNVPPNDAEYIAASNPPPAAYLATLTDLPEDVTSVKGIMTFVRAAKTDGGDASLQASVVSNGDTADGANRPITIAQTYWRDLFEVDPDTLAPWLPEAVNDVQIKINRTA